VVFVKRKVLDTVKSGEGVTDAVLFPAGDIVRQEWVVDACRDCEYHEKSWSCPPGAGSYGQAGRELSGFREAVFVKFRASLDRKQLERSVLYVEKALRESGFPRARGFFVSPCSACTECTYPEDCANPEACRPTGEAWGIDLMATSVKAGLPVEVAKEGERFMPVTIFLVE
jgi:predicted metal-binding protein